MRRVNIFLVIAILCTFLAHAIMSSIQLTGADADTLKTAAYICLGFICAHVLISAYLTVKTIAARKRSGAGYAKLNIMFWTRRISGIALLVPLVMHLLVFSNANADKFRLQVFNTGRLISQLLMVAALAVHILTDIRPMLITLGKRSPKRWSADILFVLSVLLICFAAAFVVYYLRWMRY